MHDNFGDAGNPVKLVFSQPVRPTEDIAFQQR
jgi:hypothetical protein